ncbi:MAG: hypothetical protein NZ842_18185, partial [Dehalococcoidia bacterium]|nr:hypothetical protein [Dehalococcoidia bacterium]
MNSTSSVSIIRLIFGRMRTDMRLIAAIFSGMLVAITLISGMPIYLATLEKQSIQGAIESAVEKNSP